ncbi:TaqI-like C-terminal specificity domain-containing protein [Nodularia spumigena CS-591/12]|uniref:Eco57I restriction-modification methylase domain-containing protein n=1 Tax=Nodularia spumigena TaxID=70799 RepID=UPI00232FD76B|nr:TaqI-like C-terminal specificity domain-containing protein [Nodularia spumigena]MDB9305585.1 TaqI-like C-terminal specificity domain-containing protein [Nodularia spumigena CS-591/12]MDB9400122.1 TaqI-like C-terminal specificity domain-containing protein [Microcystis aeruginosa CS-567/02-A1]
MAKITREINRQSDIPIMVLFRYGNYVTLAIINRRPNKLDRDKDVLEKITLIKDININFPHRAHIEILADLSLISLPDVQNFDQLHTGWQKVLNTSELNNKFFKEVSHWYFWATQRVTFPDGGEADESLRNATSVIRLITRLIFVWFLKEKGLVPDALFDEKQLEIFLKPLEDEESTYYKAILQNLFFATLNTEMNDPPKSALEKGTLSENRKFRGKTKQKGGRNQNYGCANAYRYQDYFINSDQFLGLCSNIPFLNGGLFECLDRDRDDASEPSPKGKEKTKIRIDGFSDREDNVLSVPNVLFFGETRKIDLNTAYGTKNKKYEVQGLINIFNRYKFTIDENTPIEEEIALDPELLGKVFENLLAEYNPETETTARKQTGSFYTPREIVNYMVDESLIAYLQNGLLDPPQPPLRRGENTEKVPLRSGENTENPSLRSGENTKKVPLSKGDLGGSEIEDKLRHLLSYSNDSHQFNDLEVDCLINAIDNLKIIDIACGSGAFPMGILQKLVFILGKLDPNNSKWKQQQKEKAISPVLKDIQVAKQISYEQARDEAIEKLQERLAEIEYEFENNEMDYPRKLFLIENCIFGVDIQPIAVQISKLRFFISLIVDQKVNNNQPNRGILPLPNLETKFVAANSLIGLETQLSLRSPEVIQKEEELKQVRQQHFKARTPKTKKKCRDKDNILRQEISQLLKSTGLESATADTLARWNPYDLNTCSDFFDPNWMFGVTDGFDICIGNPPYVRPHKLSKVFKEKLWRLYSSFVKKADLYSCFVEKTLNILKKTGIGSFILSNGFLRLDSFEKLRILLLQNTSVDLIIDFEDDVFESAIVKTCIFSFTNTYTKNKKIKIARIYSHVNLANLQFANVPQQYYQNKTYQSIFDLSYNNEIVKLKQKIGQNSIDLGNLFDISFGLKTGDDDKFLSFSKDSNEHKSLLRGENIGRYIFDYKGEYVWYVPKIMTSHRRTARPGNKLRFEQPKVLIRDTGNGLMGTYEELNFYVKDVLIISHQQKCTKTLKILVSILNSSLMKFYYETSFPTLHVQRNELAVLPMKLEFDESDQVIKIVDRILEIKRQNPKADTTELEREIDEIVYQLYGLTEEEIRIIEESVKPK